MLGLNSQTGDTGRARRGCRKLSRGSTWKTGNIIPFLRFLVVDEGECESNTPTILNDKFLPLIGGVAPGLSYHYVVGVSPQPTQVP